MIIVCIGTFQKYILDNIQNLYLHDNNEIHIITEKEYFIHFNNYQNLKLIDKNELNDFNFNNNSKLDKYSRDGFWHLCSLRLFYLYSYIEKNNINNCIHIENDVLLYYNLNNTLFHSDKICALFDCNWRVIPSIIYIPTPDKLKYKIDNFDFSKNDMENLGKFDESIIERLPIFNILHNENTEMLIKNYDKYNIIFDAAAIGQYLGGVDERNISGDTRGFINETCLIKYNNYSFYWRKNDNLYYPYIKVNDELIRIFNLHIHSKKLYLFLSNCPIEKKFINYFNKNAIVVLNRGYEDINLYDRLIHRNKIIYEKIISKIENNSFDIIIYHEGNIIDEHQKYIQLNTPELKLIFINIKKTYPKTAFDDNKNILNMELCPPTGLSNIFSLGYKHMCHFWSIDFLEYLKDYDFIIRIDEDCVINEFDINIIDKMIDSNTVYISPFFQNQDNPDVIVGLEILLNNFINENNIIPYKKFEEIKCPYTNFMIINIKYFLNHNVIQLFLDYIEKSHGIYSNRWGDLPIWGIILSILTPNNLYSNCIDISYIHDVHLINM